MACLAPSRLTGMPGAVATMTRPTLTGATRCLAIAALGLLLAQPLAATGQPSDAPDLTVVGVIDGANRGLYCTSDLPATGTFDLDRAVEDADGDGTPDTVAWTVTYSIQATCGTVASRCEGTEPYPAGLRNVEATCPLGRFDLSSLTLGTEDACPQVPPPAVDPCHTATFHLWIQHVGTAVYHTGDVHGAAVVDRTG